MTQFSKKRRHPPTKLNLKKIKTKGPFNTSFTPSSLKTASYCNAALLQVYSAAAAMAACFIFTTCQPVGTVSKLTKNKKISKRFFKKLQNHSKTLSKTYFSSSLFGITSGFSTFDQRVALNANCRSPFPVPPHGLLRFGLEELRSAAQGLGDGLHRALGTRSRFFRAKKTRIVHGIFVGA